MHWERISADERGCQSIECAGDTGESGAQGKCQRLVVTDVDPECGRGQLAVAHCAPGPAGAIAQDVSRQPEQHRANDQAQEVEELVIAEKVDWRSDRWNADPLDSTGEARLLLEHVWRGHAQGKGGQS